MCCTGIRRSVLGYAVTLALSASIGGGCHTFRSLSDCATDADCALGDRCNPDDKFCEKDTGPLVFGVSLSLTGSYAPSVVDMLGMTSFVQDYVNKQCGGVLGRTLQLQIVDDASDDDVAEQNARDFVSRRVAAVIGPVRSAQALRMQSVTHAAQVLQVSHSAAATALGPAQPAHDRYFFRTTGSIGRVQAACADYARNVVGCGRLAVIHGDDLTGIDFSDATTNWFSRMGGCMGPVIQVPAAPKPDYVSEIAQVVASGSDCVFVTSGPAIVGTMLRELKRQVPDDATRAKLRWIAPSALHTATFFDEARAIPGDTSSPSLAVGVSGCDIGSPDIDEYFQLRSAYNTQNGLPLEQDLPSLAANFFDAVALAVLAIADARGVRGRAAIRDGVWHVANDAPGATALGPMSLCQALQEISRGHHVNYQGAGSHVELDDLGTVAVGTQIYRFEADGTLNSRVKIYSEEDQLQLESAPPVAGACP